jgi:hypothetical protein
MAGNEEMTSLRRNWELGLKAHCSLGINGFRVNQSENDLKWGLLGNITSFVKQFWIVLSDSNLAMFTSLGGIDYRRETRLLLSWIRLKSGTSSMIAKIEVNLIYAVPTPANSKYTPIANKTRPCCIVMHHFRKELIVRIIVHLPNPFKRL